MAFWNSLNRTWDVHPNIEGPIELYRPTEDGTEDLPPDANFEVEYHGEYATLEDAIDAIDCCGRWLWSREDRGQYLGAFNSVPNGIEVL